LRHPSLRRPDRTEWILVFSLFLAYAWFYQGGGWQQNSRLDQIRALVGTGELRINDYLLYRPDTRDGEVEIRRVAIPGPVGSLESIRNPNSGDLSLRNGNVYPNKAPGISLLAAPAYGLVQGIGSTLGADPDAWRSLTLNAWLATALSVGLVGALGCLIFYRASRALFPEIGPLPHLAAAWTFGLATMMFPFSTMLFDHVPVAVLLLLAFSLLVRARDLSDDDRRARTLAFAGAGAAAGFAVVFNYSAGVAVPLLAAYAWRVGSLRFVTSFIVGGVAPALVLASYHALCFGSPFALPHSYMAQTFRSRESWLGMFSLPDAVVAWKLLFSSHRGLFFTSPVLLLAALGIGRMFSRRETRDEAFLCVAMFGAFLVVNAAFDRWHAGFTFGPRYLIPALPFLALGLAPAFDRLPRLTTGLAVVSAALMLLATAVNPQVPNPEKNPVRYLLLHFAGDRPQGPVSSNDLGVYEGRPYTIYAFGSERVRWNSFNVGEWVWPASRASLVPLILVLGVGVGASLRFPGRSQNSRNDPIKA